MATIYKIELVSHWTDYTKEQLQKLLENAIKKDKEIKKYKNEITIEVIELGLKEID